MSNPPSPPWNNWYHINGNTYGTWLRGDSRGWRARHHREHVEGDYKNPPPPGVYDRLEASSKRLMARAKRSVVRLSQEARELACRTMVDSLLAHGVELIVLSIDDHHYHLLARFTEARPLAHVAEGLAPSCTKPTGHGPWASPPVPPTYITDPPRHYVGIAKMRATRALGKARLAPPGTVWAKRCKVTPIRDRAHQLNVARYIAKHANRGGVVWAVWQSNHSRR